MAADLLSEIGIIRKVPRDCTDENAIRFCGKARESIKREDGGKIKKILGKRCPLTGQRCVDIGSCRDVS